MAIQVPQVILNCPMWGHYGALTDLQNEQVPVPTPDHVILAITRFSAAIASTPWDGELTPTALKFKHTVLACNCPVPVPGADEAVGEGGAAAVEEVPVAEGGTNVGDDEMEVEPVQGRAVDLQNDQAVTMRGLTALVEGLEHRLNGSMEGLERRLNASIEEVNRRVGELDRRVGELDRRVGGLDERIGGLDRRIEGLEDAFRLRDGRDKNSLRWEAGHDLRPVRVGDRPHPEGLTNRDASVIRNPEDVRAMIDQDLDSWLQFYDIDIGRRAKRQRKEMVLIRYLGGDGKRNV
ncbi:hypothetical protein JCM24511_04885 [Saitozyma sp. JCM 24511]|nr:hypothetical protein JCM24511_04885 [Saitozyma sp. JCM 24511]